MITFIETLPMNNSLTKDETDAVLGAIGIALNMLGLDVAPGDPATQDMLLLESAQTKLMAKDDA